MSTETKFVTILENGRAPEKRNSLFFEKQTAEKIEEFLKLDNQIYSLAIKTPTYIKCFNPEEVPCDLYPSLMHDSEHDTSYALQILNKQTQTKIYFIFHVFCENNAEDMFPDFTVEINESSFSNQSGNVLRDHIIKCFDVEAVINCKVLVNNNQINNTKRASTWIQEMKANPLSFKCSLTQKAIKMIESREKLLKEIDKSESLYNFNMNILYNHFKKGILKANLIENSDVDYIFNSLENLINAHAKFYDDIRTNGLKYKSQMVQIFLRHIESFSTAKHYVSRYNKIMNIVRPILDHPVIKELEELAPNESSGSPQKLESYLIMPCQRYVRYELFLNSIEKSTPKCHPDSADIASALETVRAVNKEIVGYDDIVKEVEKLTKINKRLNVDIASSTRYLITEYKIKFLDDQKGVIYLLNDLLLISHKSKKKEEKIYQENLLNVEIHMSHFTDTDIRILEDYDKTIVFESENDKNMFVNSVARNKNRLRNLVAHRRRSSAMDIAELSNFTLEK